MKNILYHLYHGHINESERKVVRLYETKEYKSYIECFDKLIKTFSEEQEKLFDAYFECESAYRDLEYERIYANGVKTGMCLAFELMDFEPPWWESNDN